MVRGSQVKPAEVLEIFRKSGALLDGHFILRSGMHSRQLFQSAMVLQHANIAGQLCEALARKIDADGIQSVISPAVGGIVVGQELARSLNKRHIFAEKEDGKLVLKRGFVISPGETFLVAEDVITQGGRVKETMDIVKSRGGVVAAAAVLVDRSTQPVNLGVPLYSLLKLEVENFPPDKLPPDLKAIPAVGKNEGKIKQ